MGFDSNAAVTAILATTHRPHILGAAILNPSSPATSMTSDARAHEIVERDGDAATTVPPSRADGPAYVTWAQRAGRLGASATDARALPPGCASAISSPRSMGKRLSRPRLSEMRSAAGILVQRFASRSSAKGPRPASMRCSDPARRDRRARLHNHAAR
jgi:hypothetical protein